MTRAWWSHRQGLNGEFAGKSVAEVLSQTGWARSVGGAAPYLTLFARCGATREAIDAALAGIEIHELPAARGCTYVVPQADYALALQVGQSFRESEMNVARKLGVTDSEIQKLSMAVLDALAGGALEPDALRVAVGPAARSLGEEGKKKGLSSTIPLTLGQLQARGDIRRIPVNGRLDQQRYKYARWEPNPRSRSKTAIAEAYTELATKYFRWIGPALLAEFQWFSGLSGKAAKIATAPLQLMPLGERLILPDELDSFRAFQAPKEPCYSLVSSMDGITALRRNVESLADENVVAQIGHVTEISHHGIFDRGTLVGLWDYDTEAEEIVWKAFVPKNDHLQKAVNRTEDFVRQQLGDARSFSLDSPKGRVSRLAALR